MGGTEDHHVKLNKQIQKDQNLEGFFFFTYKTLKEKIENFMSIASMMTDTKKPKGTILPCISWR